MPRRMTATGDRSLREIGERLRLTREALGLNQTVFARKAKVALSAYNQYEKGKMRPAIDQAIKIRDAHRLTLDWIYLGDNSGLAAALADAIKTLRSVRS